MDRSSGCGSSTVGRVSPALIDVGSGGGGDGSGGGGVSSLTGSGTTGVWDRSREETLRRFASCSTRAEALAGSLLFLSMAQRVVIGGLWRVGKFDHYISVI